MSQQHEWVVDLTAVNDNPVDLDGVADEEGSERGKNMSGVGIVLTNGTRRVEVERVAFKRGNSSSPRKSFKKALREAIDDAETAVDELNAAQCRVDDANAASASHVTTSLRDVERMIVAAQERMGALLHTIRSQAGEASAAQHQTESDHLRPRSSSSLA